MSVLFRLPLSCLFSHIRAKHFAHFCVSAFVLVLLSTNTHADLQQVIDESGITIENTITGTSGVDTLAGTALNDLMIGAESNDNLTGGNGHDVLVGGAGDDT